MAKLESRVIAVQQRPARVWQGGAGPALLLLHPLGGHAYIGWHLIWEDLARDFTVIAPDWPGFGESEAMPISQVSLASLASWVEDLREALSLEKFSIVGNSFGGTAGRLFAAEHPARVERLVLISGAGLPPAPGVIVPALARILGSGSVADPDDVGREVLRLMFHDPKLLTRELVAGLTGAMPTIMAILGKLTASPLPQHTKPAAPTLVLWGESDRFTLPSFGRALAAELQASFKSVPEAGHLPQIERPAAVLAVLREFLLP